MASSNFSRSGSVTLATVNEHVEQNLEDRVIFYHQFTTFASTMDLKLGAPSQLLDSQEPISAAFFFPEEPAILIPGAPPSIPSQIAGGTPAKETASEAETAVEQCLDDFLRTIQQYQPSNAITPLRAKRCTGIGSAVGSSQQTLHHKAKPDILILPEEVMDARNLIWEHVEILVEVTTQQIGCSQKCLQTVGKLHDMFNEVWGRFRLWALVFCTAFGGCFLINVDHGNLQMCPMSSSDLTRFLYWYVSAPPQARGLDTRYSLRDGCTLLKIDGNLGAELALVDCLGSHGQLIGRNSKVGVFKHSATGKPYIVKDGWTRICSGRKNEKDFLNQLTGIDGTPELATCQPPPAEPSEVSSDLRPGCGIRHLQREVAAIARTIGVESTPTSGGTSVSEAPPKSRCHRPEPKRQKLCEAGDHSDEVIHRLRHQTIVMKAYPKARTLISALEEKLCARNFTRLLRMWIRTHWQCFEAGVLHGDINPSNLILYECNGTTHGGLIDFDYSYELDNNHEVLPSLRYARSGVRFFLCSAVVRSSTPAFRSFRTELDSFWWVTLWYAILSADPDHPPDWISDAMRGTNSVIENAKTAVLAPANLARRMGEMEKSFQEEDFQHMFLQFFSLAVKPYLESQTKPAELSFDKSRQLYHDVIALFDAFLIGENPR
ncbi:MAG: hypothetical protein M1820_009672 [Bogoriella megaspora]|nr:MAG: hypothetical protein M1820_009672 [Bogoriella megaspora]